MHIFPAESLVNLQVVHLKLFLNVLFYGGIRDLHNRDYDFFVGVICILHYT
jgi:hypothetical protein